MAHSPHPADQGRGRFASRLSSNAFRAGIVVLSAAIIFGAYAFAQRTTSDDPGQDLAQVTELDDIYEQARKAAEDGDRDTAITLLERVLADDPSHARADALLSRLNGDNASGATQTGDEPGATPDQQPAAPEDDDAGGVPVVDPWLGPSADMGLFLPEVIDGWQRGLPDVSQDSAGVSFDPSARGAIRLAVFSVNDRQTEAAAKQFIEDVSKRAYPQDGASVKVGNLDGYFGTNGAIAATVAFARGRYAFEVTVTADNVHPRTVRDAAIGLAQEFEATR